MESTQPTFATAAGMPSFRMIRRQGLTYIDKTDLVYRLANDRMFYFLSRPRRFGKSLLVDTLDAYLSGERELFKGLKIDALEKEWRKFPIVRLDMSKMGVTAESLKKQFDTQLKGLEKKFGLPTADEMNYGGRLEAIIRGAHEASGNTPVAVLVDEFDTPLYSTWNTQEHEACKGMYREAFSALKTASDVLRLVFITGICKFTQVSLFSTLNNLYNCSFDAAYATICGFTWQEIEDNYPVQLADLAARRHETSEQLKAALIDMYDGYRFSLDAPDKVFNPYDIALALSPGGGIFNYWASSGATSMLGKFVTDLQLRLLDYQQCSLTETVLRTSDVTGGPTLFLYQCGYLTQRCRDPRSSTRVLLEIPNQEVREALFTSVVATLNMTGDEAGTANEFDHLRQALANCDIPEAERALTALVADAPYSNKKLASMFVEERYRFVMSNILHAVRMRVQVEKPCAGGRIDLIAENDRYIYVFELKQKKYGGFRKAANQLIANGYTAPFEGDQRQVVALAIEVEDEGKRIIKWRTIAPGTPPYELPPDTPRSPEEMEKDDEW